MGATGPLAVTKRLESCAGIAIEPRTNPESVRAPQATNDFIPASSCVSGRVLTVCYGSVVRIPSSMIPVLGRAPAEVVPTRSHARPSPDFSLSAFSLLCFRSFRRKLRDRCGLPRLVMLRCAAVPPGRMAASTDPEATWPIYSSESGCLFSSRRPRMMPVVMLTIRKSVGPTRLVAGIK
jgi:hypothetical protein